MQLVDEHFRLLVESVKDYAIYLLDPDGLIRSWNAGAQRLKGYDSAEIVGRSFSLFFSPSDGQAGKPAALLREALRAGRAEDVGWRRRKDGSQFWASAVITALHDSAGQHVGFAKVTRDLEPERTLELWTTTLRSIGDAVIATDTRELVTFMNPAAERLTGWTAAEALGRPCAEVFQLSEAAAPLAPAPPHHRPHHRQLHRRDGSIAWVDHTAAPIRTRDDAVQGSVLVFRDVGKERDELDEQRKLQAQLALANRMKDEFLATISHELRTPLQAILGYASMLERGVARDPQKALATIVRNASAQARIVEDMLDMSRITSGKLRLSMGTFLLAGAIAAAVDALRPAAAARRIELVERIAGDAGAVYGDGERLQQVVWNLVSNAVKFTDPGGTVEVSAERVPGAVQISVQDTGRGIAREDLRAIFDRFRQLDGSAARSHGGLGLGLAIVRALVEAHGGTVEADSEGPGRGARFTVRLPAPAAVVSSAPGEAAAGGGSAARPLHGVAVLIVEDDPDGRELIAEALTGAGARVERAESAAVAFARFLAEPPHVLVSDIGMPDEDGYSLLRRIRALPPEKGGDVPAVALTAFARPEDARRAEEAGFQLHLAKPAMPDRLVAAVLSMAPVR